MKWSYTDEQANCLYLIHPGKWSNTVSCQIKGYTYCLLKEKLKLNFHGVAAPKIYSYKPRNQKQASRKRKTGSRHCNSDFLNRGAKWKINSRFFFPAFQSCIFPHVQSTCAGSPDLQSETQIATQEFTDMCTAQWRWLLWKSHYSCAL